MSIRQTPKTKLPIGEEFFADMIEGNKYYVDKTLFIKDILDKGAKFTLCTRPRRFGKTLNQNMLKCFFEDTAPIGGKDTKALFRGLKIESAGEEYFEHQGQYPVVFLSFAGVEADNFKSNGNIFKRVISAEFRRHRYVAEKIIDEYELKKFKMLSSEEGDIEMYTQSLSFLCECLERYHGRKTVILIDEYDVPLQNAWSCGFYDDMIKFIRPFMKDALKGNEYLQFAVITGCLRVSKESIFTGLNNMEVVSILSDRYNEYFGFTQDEVDAMFAYYDIEGKTQIVKDWYNGYMFGDTTVYNPWSVINSVNAWRDNPKRLPEPYWANTSGNSIVRQLIDNADSNARDDIEKLIGGGTISKVVREDVIYDDIEKSINNLWGFLFFTGYLKKTGERLDGVQRVLDLCIPNWEVRYIYETQITEWFDERYKEKDFGKFNQALLDGNADAVRDEINNLLLDSMSYMDGKEDFYHGIIVGALARLQDFVATSNREAGSGRCDILVRQKSCRKKAMVIELKWLKQNPNKKVTADELRCECDSALKQIEDNKYDYELVAEEYVEIMKYGIAFCGKYCEVKVGQ